jgi:hypothetical protein
LPQLQLLICWPILNSSAAINFSWLQSYHEPTYFLPVRWKQEPSKTEENQVIRRL